MSVPPGLGSAAHELLSSMHLIQSKLLPACHVLAIAAAPLVSPTDFDGPTASGREAHNPTASTHPEPTSRPHPSALTARLGKGLGCAMARMTPLHASRAATATTHRNHAQLDEADDSPTGLDVIADDATALDEAIVRRCRRCGPWWPLAMVPIVKVSPTATGSQVNLLQLIQMFVNATKTSRLKCGPDRC